MTRGDDRGSVTVLVAIALAAVVAVLALGLQLAGAVIARHRAAAAADLGALAGALALQAAGDPCGAAGGVVDRNGARMTSCEVIGWDVRITAAVPVTGGLVGGTAVAAARAGPATG